MQSLSTGLPSPTLTNPDMILPCVSNSADSTPSPSHKPRLSSSPETPRRSPIFNTEGQANGAGKLVYGNGIKTQDEPQKDMEGKAGDLQNRLANRGHSRSKSPPLASSPTLHDEYDGTFEDGAISEDVNPEGWDGLDTAIDDAENQYQENLSENPMDNQGYRRNLDELDDAPRSNLVNLDEDEDDPFSYAALSQRAEVILANAKKRLMKMEGNLNRARYSLNSGPSSSTSLTSNGSPRSPSLATLQEDHLDSELQQSWDFSPSKHRQVNSPLSTGGGLGHSRVFSETSVPSSLHTAPLTKDYERDGKRAASALGTTGMSATGSRTQSGWRGPDHSRNGFWNSSSRGVGHSSRQNSPLQPLDEDEPSLASFSKSGTNINSPLSGDQPETRITPNSGATSYFDFKQPSAHGLTRSNSALQVCDLRDQMQDLKGKISSLKQRAREDTLRRRSLQSLRTPSPFTAAEQWYTRTSGYGEPQDNIDATPDRAMTYQKTQNTVGEVRRVGEENLPVQDVEKGFVDRIMAEDSNGSMPLYTENHDDAALDDMGPSSQHSADSILQADGDSCKSSLELSTNETTSDIDSLYGDQDFHDTSPLPIGGRHEDREDAFDYEHFFLHSSMGQNNLKRRGSHSSTDSVETTKPIANSIDGNGNLPSDDDTPRKRGHTRLNSIDSVSTVASFATATEGKTPNEDADEDEWIYWRPMAGAWQPDYPPDFKTGRKKDSQRDISRKEVAHTKSPSPLPVHHPSMLVSSSTAPATLENGLPRAALHLSDSDKELLEKIVASLSKVCTHLDMGSNEAGKYKGRPWRRRLDAARRVLDGDLADDTI